MWKDFLRNTVLKPGLERLGTVVAAILVGWGASQPVANQIAIGIGAAAGLAFDLAVIEINRRKGK